MLYGGRGDDIYVVESATQRIVEKAHGGSDAVRAVCRSEARQYLEDLRLIGSEGATGIGNSLNNALTGSDGDDRLSGRERR